MCMCVHTIAQAHNTGMYIDFHVYSFKKVKGIWMTKSHTEQPEVEPTHFLISVLSYLRGVFCFALMCGDISIA